MLLHHRPILAAFFTRIRLVRPHGFIGAVIPALQHLSALAATVSAWLISKGECLHAVVRDQ